MNKMLVLSLIPLSALSMETYQINPKCFKTSPSLGEIDLYRSGKTFYVGKDTQVSEIPGWNTDKQLKQMDMKQLAALMQQGYLRVSQLSDGEYKIEAKVRGNGGGLIAGKIAYGVTKGACWAFVLGTVGSVVGKLIGRKNETARDATSTWVAGTIREHAGNTGKTIFKAPGGTLPTGAVIGTVIRKKMGDRNAAEVVALGTATCGGKIVMAIEALSVAVGGFFTAIPWLP